jgi:Fe-Mn family superoxide dismutase
MYTGTELENKSVVQTIIDTAPDRSKTLAFNYASQALNNSFFLDTLVRQP